MTNGITTSKKLNEMMSGIGGIAQASQGTTGAERAMGIANTVASIMALMA